MSKSQDKLVAKFIKLLENSLKWFGRSTEKSNIGTSFLTGNLKVLENEICNRNENHAIPIY